MSVLFWLGLGLVGLLVLLPLAFLLRVLLGIGAAYLEHRRDRAAVRLHAVAGLGELESVDGRRWSGDVRGVHVTIESPDDGPPGPAVAAGAVAVLDALPQHLERAKAWLADDGLNSVDGLEVLALTWSGDGAFSLDLTDPRQEDEWVHEVWFRHGEPVEAAAMH